MIAIFKSDNCSDRLERAFDYLSVRIVEILNLAGRNQLDRLANQALKTVPSHCVPVQGDQLLKFELGDGPQALDPKTSNKSQPQEVLGFNFRSSRKDSCSNSAIGG